MKDPPVSHSSTRFGQKSMVAVVPLLRLIHVLCPDQQAILTLTTQGKGLCLKLTERYSDITPIITRE